MLKHICSGGYEVVLRVIIWIGEREKIHGGSVTKAGKHRVYHHLCGDRRELFTLIYFQISTTFQVEMHNLFYKG